MNNRQQTSGRNADVEKREGDTHTHTEEEEHENHFGTEWKLLRHASYGKTH